MLVKVTWGGKSGVSLLSILTMGEGEGEGQDPTLSSCPPLFNQRWWWVVGKV